MASYHVRPVIVSQLNAIRRSIKGSIIACIHRIVVVLILLCLAVTDVMFVVQSSCTASAGRQAASWTGRKGPCFPTAQPEPRPRRLMPVFHTRGKEATIPGILPILPGFSWCTLRVLREHRKLSTQLRYTPDCRIRQPPTSLSLTSSCQAQPPPLHRAVDHLSTL